MRLLGPGAAVAALAALALPVLVADAARADELLVMPYSCSIAGGQPVLTPGLEQGHRIVGQREQRKHKACSPVNPSMCRYWTVHRFDMDCDGRRVSWVSVVAATTEGSRRAWLLDGRLLLRMGPRWSLAPDDPCAQGSGPDERPVYGGELRRQCAQRLAMAPPPVVEMPFGYAPMLGIDGIFVTAKTPPGLSKTPPTVAGEPPSKSASVDAKTPPAPPRPESPLEPKAGDPKAKDAQLPPLPPVPAPQPASKVASTPKATPTSPPALEAPATKTEAEPKPPAPKLASPPAKEISQQGPRPVILPPPPAGPEVEKKAAPSQSKPAAVDASPTQKVAVAPPPKVTERTAPPVKPTPPQPKAESESAVGPGLLSLFRTTTTGAIIAFAGLALGLLAAFTLARRREHARDAGRRRRDISALSLDGRHAKASARAGADGRRRSQRSPPPNAPSSAPPRPAFQPPAPPPDLMGRLAMAEVGDLGDRMPRTREEALEVLGIGIAPSANATAIKKIVDGLRMSWHPDLAKDETDRTLREQRSKQINAAWDILQSQRAEV